MSNPERRKVVRVGFERPVPVYAMAIDGTWRRECTMADASDEGAKLVMSGSIEGLNLNEFFLVLSSTGLAYRRCELSWVNGDQIGAKFVKHKTK
jgi:PilZ domain